MIKQEKKKVGGHYFNHTYSDSEFYILQVETGTKYNEAYDVIPCRYPYEETSEKIETEEKE